MDYNRYRLSKINDNLQKFVLTKVAFMDNTADKSKYTIRKAEAADASRIAEILVFAKRTHYRPIFQDDAVSFGKLQVLPIAQDLLDHPEKLSQYQVYDDGIIKGLIRLDVDEIAELYVEPLLEGQGVGSALIGYAMDKILHPHLWVLDGNDKALEFYQKHGFTLTGEKREVEGTGKTESLMFHNEPLSGKLSRKVVRVIIDRPLGSTHPEYPDTVYPVNYGYIDGYMGGDGESQDAYVLGINEPVTEVIGKVIAVIHRLDDNEDKWVVAAEGSRVFSTDIVKNTRFIEKYFKTTLTLL